MRLTVAPQNYLRSVPKCFGSSAGTYSSIALLHGVARAGECIVLRHDIDPPEVRRPEHSVMYPRA